MFSLECIGQVKRIGVGGVVDSQRVLPHEAMPEPDI